MILTPREADLLELLLRNARRVVTREQAIAADLAGRDAGEHRRSRRDEPAAQARRAGSDRDRARRRLRDRPMSLRLRSILAAAVGDDARRRRARLGGRRARRAASASRARPDLAHAGRRGRTAGCVGARTRHAAGCPRFSGRLDAGDGGGRRPARPHRRPARCRSEVACCRARSRCEAIASGRGRVPHDRLRRRPAPRLFGAARRRRPAAEPCSSPPRPRT